jgi:hypothetical protein
LRSPERSTVVLANLTKSEPEYYNGRSIDNPRALSHNH